MDSDEKGLIALLLIKKRSRRRQKYRRTEAKLERGVVSRSDACRRFVSASRRLFPPQGASSDDLASGDTNDNRIRRVHVKWLICSSSSRIHNTILGLCQRRYMAAADGRLTAMYLPVCAQHGGAIVQCERGTSGASAARTRYHRRSHVSEAIGSIKL
ncbi:hypothetical protein EVAR_54980_1 [Eumeta japonica]|uniref:Uncharacterized protein n=1 Tax=Eumeta variegata TaxID=151549 RepID=A0A4C1Z6K2_EUMVA|nr:hypothetical protein EVAR_54980_1 [Eumeta japonica]